MTPSRKGFLDLASGVGLVMASMIGAGVFLSAGFMAQELSPGWILAAWVAGAFLALAGARTYAEACILVPRSGGEYRYLSELVHPAVGYLAGWASLLVGFAAPTAISAYGAAAFAATVVGGLDARWAATTLIVGLTLVHAAALGLSKWTQNGLILLNALLVVAFIAAGLALGNPEWPTWTAPGSTEGFAPLPFATSLFFVAYAFSGWNAAAYAAEEFVDPPRDVPRAMMIGCAIVGVLYLLVNWVLVANVTPEQAEVVFRYEEARVTLGHVVARELVGNIGSNVMSLAVAVAMVSSASAMLLVGPRVYAEMARDGFLPSVLRGAPGKPPRASVFLQGTLAVSLLHAHSVGELLSNVAGVLVFFSALVAVGLFAAPKLRPDLRRPRRAALVAAAVYAGSSGWMLYSAFESRASLLIWLAMVGVVGLGAYALTRRRIV